MTEVEFTRWVEKHFAAFPRVQAFLESLDRGNPGGLSGTRVLKSWEEVLRPAELGDAMEVTRRMARGADGFKPPEDFKEHEIPAFVLERCDRLRTRRLTEEIERERAAESKAVRPSKPLDTKALLRQVEDEMRKGGNAHEIANRLCPVPLADQRSYACLVCEDQGLARVWANQSMHAARYGQLTPERGVYQVGIRCWCRQGERYEKLSMRDFSKGKEGQRDTPLIYNDRDFLTFEHFEDGQRCNGHTPEGVARLVEFMAKRYPIRQVVEIEY